ncbi:MAG: oxaloacetate decarboxylase [Paludibacteraceae bacterium]|nr:oxaloacetate decarboxylase [Paludibacteraceae bacterium]
MKKEIQFSLVYRDMWQSSGKYVPRRDQLAKIAPVIIDMGCFDRVETNGGASEQVNLLYGENPNLAVRTFCKPFNEAGIKTHMLDRGLNALRMNPVPADVRQLMYKVKHAQGTNITRIFCGLNDPRNIIPSIKWAKEAGMTAQATMCITYSAVHTREYYINLAEQLIEGGAQEICLKDMAGIGRPAMLGDIVRAIKEKHPDIIIQYHGHTGPGFSVASMLEVAKAGGDVLDVAMEPLSWGMVHPDVITIQAMLRDAGFLVKDINMKAYMEARSLTQSFIDEFLGYWIDPRNSKMTSLLVGCGLPGGMMGSLMADLKGMHAAINANLRKRGEKELNEDELLVELFQEVQRIWPMLGTPCLVTPFSQYVKNAALMNLFSRSMGEKDFTRMDPAMWGMILGKSGKLPGTLAPEIIELAKEKGYEFYTDDPQKLYPDVLPQYIKEMEELGWDRGQDDEELFEFAMHDKQYREFKSGIAKEQFNKDLLERMEKAAKGGQQVVFLSAADKRAILHPSSEPLEAPVNGKLFWELNYDEGSTAPVHGKLFLKGEPVAYLQTAHGVEVLSAFDNARIVAIDKEAGETIAKGQTICWLEKADLDEEAKLAVNRVVDKAKQAVKDVVKAAKQIAADKPKQVEQTESKWKDSMNVIKKQKK